MLTLLASVSLAEPVETLIDNGDPADRVDIAILGDGFTSDETGKFRSSALNVVEGLFRDEPLRNYRRFFNVHIVTVESPESGADHPERNPPVYKDTALGAYYNCGGTPRCTCVDSSKVEPVLNRSLEVAERDFILILLNDETWGGCWNGRYAVQANNDSVAQVTLHELGHAFGLCDEYAYDSEADWCRLSEPRCVNATAETRRPQVKWNSWIDGQTPLPTTSASAPLTVGLFEGAKYCPAGLYRPTHRSMMRVSGAPWGAVNTEALIKGIYRIASPLESVSVPFGFPIFENYGQRVFSARVARPEPDTTETAWFLDGNKVGSQDYLVVKPGELRLGRHTLVVQVTDRTSMVRRDDDALLQAQEEVEFEVVPFADEDGDGMPTAWEKEHGLNPENASDADTDADGDGATNLNEFIAGTDPRNPNEFPMFSLKKAIGPVREEISSLDASDLDRDGDADFVAAVHSGDRIGWFENGGGGVFSNETSISSALDEPTAVRAADLDGDGDVDVISLDDDGVMWFENRGAGDFSARSVIGPAADDAQALFVQDLDGDGDADVLYESEDGFVWHDNDGAGKFPAARLIDSFPTDSLSSADLDGDGDADIVSGYGRGGGIVDWYENLGNGEFVENRVARWDKADGVLVHVADLDGDGDADLVSASPHDQAVSWHENQADGTFANKRLPGARSDWFPISVDTADLDGDGDIDVLCAFGTDYDDSGFVGWYENLGGGHFASPQPVAHDAYGDIEAVDVDGDGDQDFAAAFTIDVAGDGQMSWFENHGAAGDDHGDSPATATTVLLPATVHAEEGRLEAATDVDVFKVWVSAQGTLRAATQGGTNTRGALVGASGNVLAEDRDSGDGSNFEFSTPVQPGVHFIEVSHQDSVGVGGSYRFTASFSGCGSKTFSEQRVIAGDADRVVAVEPADIDDDGRLDVVYAHDGAISWRSNLGGGAFADPAEAVAAAVGSRGPQHMRVADIDGDGDQDVVSRWGDLIVWTENDGNGRFRESHRVIEGMGDDGQVFVADLDGDMDLDVLAASEDRDQIVWRMNAGGGTWSPETRVLPAIEKPIAVHAADLDGDGDADVIAGSRRDIVSWHENLGNGRFSSPNVIGHRVGGPIDLFSADMNADGKLDVVVAGLDGDRLQWFENLGSGRFSTAQDIAEMADGVYAAHAADVDGDGDLDLLSALANGDAIAWHENLASGVFCERWREIDRANEPTDVSAADLDGDGDPDIISAAHGQDTVAWYENPGNNGDDHGNSADTATTLSLPSGTRGVLEQTGDVDVFRIWVAGRGTLTASTRGNADTYAELTQSGRVIAQDDESGGGGNFRIESEVTAGVHELAVRGRGGAGAVYRLDVSFVPALARIGDTALLRAVEESLGKVPGSGVTEIELGRLADLRATNAGVVSLDGLELAENLKQLHLPGNSISDLSPLARLTELERIDLSNNAIEDLQPLLLNPGIGPGDEVYLQGNPLSDESVRNQLPELHARGVRVYITTASVAPAASMEGELLEFRVQLAKAITQDVELAWRVTSGTATAGVDLAHQSGRVRIPSGQTLGSFTVATDRDREAEGHESTFVLIEGRAWGAPEQPEVLGVIVERNGPMVDVPVFAAASDSTRQGFVRVDNYNSVRIPVHVTATDDYGNRRVTTLAINPFETVHFNSGDLELGNTDKGIFAGIGAGTGNWRLEVRGIEVEVLTYMRTRDGFLTSLHDLVPAEPGGYRVPVFNPGSNLNQVSHLRLFNRAEQQAAVTIEGIDDSGNRSSGRARIELAAGETRTISAQDLESGAGLDGQLGDGTGKWRLLVESNRDMGVASLLESPTGHLTNLSTVGASKTLQDGTIVYLVPLFPSASDANDRQGFVRIVNPGAERDVHIKPFDDSGRDYATQSLRIGAGRGIHFNSDDFELGNAEKGLPGAGAGQGDWWLQISGEPEFEVMAYVRRRNDGFLTSMHDVAALENGDYFVPTINPGSNRNQVSQLRLVNIGNSTATVTIGGVDGSGNASHGDVRLTIPAQSARTLSAQELEAGGAGFTGALGDGDGKWRLLVDSDTELVVMSLLESPSGHLTNLSTRTGVLK